VSPLRAVLLLTGSGMLAISAVAGDNGKQVRKPENSPAATRSTEWDRRTDNEWRRYTEKSSTRRRAGDVRRTERLRGMDTDGDGIVSRSEWRGNEQAFSRLDRDRDGLITARDGELRRMKRSSTDPYTRRNDRFRVLDRNGDGIISQDEWNRR
jgi:hypothetical protein